METLFVRGDTAAPPTYLHDDVAIIITFLEVADLWLLAIVELPVFGAVAIKIS